MTSEGRERGRGEGNARPDKRIVALAAPPIRHIRQKPHLAEGRVPHALVAERHLGPAEAGLVPGRDGKALEPEVLEHARDRVEAPEEGVRRLEADARDRREVVATCEDLRVGREGGAQVVSAQRACTEGGSGVGRRPTAMCRNWESPHPSNRHSPVLAPPFGTAPAPPAPAPAAASPSRSRSTQQTRPSASILNSTRRTPNTSRSESSVRTPSTRPLSARKASWASAS